MGGGVVVPSPETGVVVVPSPETIYYNVLKVISFQKQHLPYFYLKGDPLFM